VNGLINKFISVLLVVALQLPTATLTLAQSSPDIRSPVIELTVIAESEANNTQVFTAQVIEDNLLKDVFLYFRRSGQQPFTPVAMTQVGTSDNYSATLTTDPTDLRAIEYYIQARDEGGNRTVEGYAFDPYTRVLIANETIINTTAEPSNPSTEPVTTQANQTSQSTSKVRWWHIVAGVVVVGAVASLASGDSSDGGSSEDNTVPLTVNITGP